MSKRKKDLCTRCGQCCRTCRYLIRYIDGTTRCLIYKHRLGAMTGVTDVSFCTYRDDVHVNFPGCPYNKPEWGDVQ